MKRLPVYHEADKRYRIASVPNGQWQFQYHEGGKGQKHVKGAKVPAPHYDPWVALARPTDYVTARRQMDTKVAAQKVAVAA